MVQRLVPNVECGVGSRIGIDVFIKGKTSTAFRYDAFSFERLAAFLRYAASYVGEVPR